MEYKLFTCIQIYGSNRRRLGHKNDSPSKLSVKIWQCLYRAICKDIDILLRRTNARYSRRTLLTSVLKYRRNYELIGYKNAVRSTLSCHPIALGTHLGFLSGFPTFKTSKPDYYLKNCEHLRCNCFATKIWWKISSLTAKENARVRSVKKSPQL